MLYFALLLCRQDTIAASQAVWNGFDIYGICLVHFQLRGILGMVLSDEYIYLPKTSMLQKYEQKISWTSLLIPLLFRPFHFN